MRKVTILLLLVSMVCTAVCSQAITPDPAGTQPADPTRSWQVLLLETGVGAVDRLGFEWVSGLTFATPYIVNFDLDGEVGEPYVPGNWAIGFADPYYIEAVSPEATEWVAFWIVYEDPLTEPTAFLFKSYEGETLKDLALVHWDGAAWGADLVNACCLRDDTCVVVTDAECADLNGDTGPWPIDCTPHPCGTTPSEESNWGRIKHLFR